MAAPAFRILDHPADLGIEARGNTLEEAFEAAAGGLLSVIVDPGSVAPRETRAVRLPASDDERLLVRWLGEVLFLVDAGGFLPARFRVAVPPDGGLEAEVRGEPIDRSRHRLRVDVKAVTYHGIAVRREAGGCSVTVYLDV